MKITPFVTENRVAVYSILVLSDIHSEYIDLTAFFTAKRFFENTPKKRRKIFLLGDILDFRFLVKKLESFKQARKLKDFDGYFVPEAQKEYEWFEWFLSEIRDLVYDYSDIYYIEGNHEQRLYRDYFSSFVLHEYAHNFDLPRQLKFKERGIHYIRYNDWLSLNTKAGSLLLTHGIYCGANPIKKHVDVAHASVMFGHTHELGSRSFKTVEDTFIGYNNPCLCGVQPDYLEGKPQNWSVGFSTIQLTPDNFWVNQFNIKNGLLYDAHGRKI